MFIKQSSQIGNWTVLKSLESGFNFRVSGFDLSCVHINAIHFKPMSKLLVLLSFQGKLQTEFNPSLFQSFKFDEFKCMFVGVFYILICLRNKTTTTTTTTIHIFASVAY